MFFFQAEEPSIILGLAISLSSLEEVKDESYSNCIAPVYTSHKSKNYSLAAYS